MIKLLSQNIYVLVIFTFTLGANISSQAAELVRDTVVNDLPEVEVEAENQRMGHNLTVYYPDEKTRKFSMDAIDLLQRMGISELIVNPIQNSVTTNMGEGVAIYINYVRANQYDLAGLKCSDVQRVEYIDSPTDPRFDGARHVVNIFTKVYLYGGYTKLTGNYSVWDFQNPSGNIYSKLSYKKTTFDAYLGGTYFYNRHMESEESQTFRLPGGDMERHADSRGGHRERMTFPISLRMTQSMGKINIQNNFSYSFSDISRSSSSGSLYFIPTLDDKSYSYISSTPAIHRSFAWNGTYSFFLPKGWFLRISPYFTHTHNNTFSTYVTDIAGSSPIVNNARENANSAKLSGQISTTINSRHYLTFQLIGELMRTKVEYFGSNSDVMNFSDNWARGNLYYTAEISERLSVSADAALQNNYYKTNQYRVSVWSPTVNAQIIYSGKRNNRLTFDVSYALDTPAQNLRSTNIQQDNEFLWFTGNPFLGNSHQLNITGGYSQMLSKRFSLSVTAGYNSYFNIVKDRYSLYDDHTSLLRSYWNNGNYHVLTLSANLTGRFMGNRLMVQVTPQLRHSRLTGENAFRHTPLACNLFAQYYLGRFSLSGWYYIYTPGINPRSGTYTKYPDYYGAQATCVLGPWNLKLSVSNFFTSKRRDSRTVMKSSLYSYVLENYTGTYRSAVALTAVYTFGYGKKINDRNEITAPQENSSLILTK